MKGITLKKILLLLILASSYLPLMAMHKTVIPLNVHVAPEIAQATMITIPLPGEDRTERLDITENEPISYQEFKDLLADCHSNGLNYSIARVETSDPKNKTDHVHYYDARMLNEWIKNSRNRHDISTAYTNPNNGLPMQKIDYFKIYPTSNDTATFQCSYNDHFCSPDPEKVWSDILNDPLYNEYRIARQWRCGSKFREQNFAKAYRCFERLSQQTIHPALAANAQLHMASMWYYGEGREKNIMQAIEHFTEVANASNPALLLIAIQASFNLAIIYRDMLPGFVLRNSPELENLRLHSRNTIIKCNAVINAPQATSKQKLKAKEYRAYIYSDYTPLSMNNHNRALQAFEELAHQQEDPVIAQDAQENLRKINRAWSSKLFNVVSFLNNR
jgi:hypothetical protein